MLGKQLSNQSVSGRRERQRAAIRDEMDRILSHPTFKTSNRCIELLRYVVEHGRNGVEDGIRERTLGIEVFGREADYDVGADPIVRRVAGEVRKRLAQYYQEEPDGHAVKIHLLRGNYLPEFEFPDPQAKTSAAQETDDKASGNYFFPQIMAPLKRVGVEKWIIASAILLSISVVGLVVGQLNIFSSPIDRVWQPLLNTDGGIIVCLPDDTALRGKLPVPVSSALVNDMPASTLFRDLRVGNSVATVLSRQNKHAELLPSSTLKYSDFQRSPVVLIGGLNNPWVPAFLSKLRYTVHANPATGERWIEDAQAPSKRDWRIDGKSFFNAPPEDYAVLTRVFNKETGQWIVALSGLKGYATQAAGDLTTNPEAARKIPLRLRAKGNFQIVLRTSIMGEEPGPVEVVAFENW